MKKILLNIAAALLIFTTASFTSSAEEAIDQDSLNKSGSMNISYDEEISYMVTIPAGVTFVNDGDKEPIERGVQASNVRIKEGTSLVVNVASLNDFKMKNNDGYIDYSLNANGKTLEAGSSYDILVVNAGENSGWVILRFISDLDKTNALYAGTYSDTLTFTVYIS